jgi:hypothetical protein
MPSEKYAARRGRVEEGRRMIPACFARVSQRWTSRTYVHFLLIFQPVRTISKTRNQLSTTPKSKQQKYTDIIPEVEKDYYYAKA